MTQYCHEVGRPGRWRQCRRRGTSTTARWIQHGWIFLSYCKEHTK